MIRKLIYLFAIILCMQVISCQTGNDEKSNKKSVIIIYDKFSGICGSIAIKIVGDSAQIDTCFDQKKNSFNIDKSELVTQNNLYSQIFELKNKDWQKIENDINKNKNCDYALPFIVKLTENKKTKTYSLKRIMNCYPDSAKQIMEGLDKYFGKMR